MTETHIHRFGDKTICECGKTIDQVYEERQAARAASPEPRRRARTKRSEAEEFARERRRADLQDLRNERRRMYGR